ncbi:ABC transporter substrate-binding protein [Nitriliruptoraceae bacterium ZYF776]|nr:ABC transporter substrate-binding protein [Profundirhabdus halotolerans]
MTACAGGTDGTDGAEAAAGGPSAEAAPDGGVAASLDPRGIRGPATVVLDDPDVHPIADTPEPQLPVTVASADGAEVTITDADRILAVDLYGTLAEIVFSLGLGDQVVGRDTSTGFPSAAHLPVVTPGGHDLNAEAILDLQPTVVLTDGSIGPSDVQLQLREAGIPVVFFEETRDVDGVTDRIVAVGEALGLPAEAAALVERTETELEEARALVPDVDEPLRVAFLYVRGTAGVYLLAGPGSGADSLVATLGAVDVGTDIGLTRPFTPLTSEALITAAPDVVLVMTGGLESVGGVDGMLANVTGLAQTPAGQNRRVVDGADTELLSFGPRVGRVAAALAGALYRPVAADS